MSQFIDRRYNTRKKSAVNRQRFLRRYKDQIKKAVANAIAKRSITDIENGEKVYIPAKDINEPKFQKGQGGSKDFILPGNDQYLPGDHLERPKSSAQSGSNATNEGEGTDNFTFDLSTEEFMDIYFEDLELPALVKKDLAKINTFKRVRAGVTNTGIPTNINVVRSMRQAISRRIALANPHKKKLKLLEAILIEEQSKKTPNADKITQLQHDIAKFKKKIKAIPFLDTLDLRYNHRVLLPAPAAQAVMFCIMDVSGSMDETKKDIAKQFFILLYLFLKKNYAKIDIVFIRHHTSAKEVEEEEFFYSRETGGTVVSSSLELLNQIMEQRYNYSNWNLYVAQASDGDNWNADSPHCQKLLEQQIMPFVQYYAYIEILPRHHQSLWEVYSAVKDKFENFAMENIESLADIYPVFRELFKRKPA